jgi:hypothetical protein
MGIKLDAEAVDAQGLPVVTWQEDRNHFAPGGIDRARIACFIQPDEVGVLQFVAAGSVHHGAFVEARPWEALHSFGVAAAEQLYRAGSDRALLEVFASKSKTGAGRMLSTDGAQVMLANFPDRHASLPMHLNCAEASLVEMAVLHDRLQRAFIDQRTNFIHERCCGIWPSDEPFIAYEPPARPDQPSWVVWLVDLSIVFVLGFTGFGLYWLITH